MRYSKPVFITIACLLFSLPSIGLQSEEMLTFPFSSFQLENGLQVILAEDYAIPVVSVVVAYNVGSVNDREGKTGLAYLTRNLLFQGSRNIRKLQHINFINRIGGRVNAQTGLDKTILSQTVSSNHLATVLWLEADRMISLNITAENLEQAKNAIIDELNSQKYSDPYIENAIQFDGLLFGHNSYSRSLRGKETDIREITVKDVTDFYSTYFTPNNAVLCITGNINKEKTSRLVKKYFQTIPRGKEHPPSQIHNVPENTGSETTIKNSLASSPGFFLGYQISPPRSPDFYALTLVEYILLKGNSSRLYKRLMRRERLAIQMRGGIEKRSDRAAFSLFVTNTNEYTKEMSLKAIASEINRLRTTPVTEEEFRKAKNVFKRDYIKRFSTSWDKAIFLAEAYLAGISIEELPDELGKYLRVSATRIPSVMNRYFRQGSTMLNIEIK